MKNCTSGHWVSVYLHYAVFKGAYRRNDGGFAVSDFSQVEPSLGTMADLNQLTAALRTPESAFAQIWCSIM
jgi:maltooligosyltrehalose synthase